MNIRYPIYEGVYRILTVQSCTERLIIFLPIGLTVGPDKKAAKNTLSNKVGEEDFSTASVSGS